MGGISGGGAKNTQGGISPEQMSLANFTFGQNAMKNASDFSNAGMGMSTGLTQMDAGAQMGEALNIGQMSLSDMNAMNAFNSQAKANLGSSIGSLGGIFGSSGG
jgi:hypothetical protein